MFYLSFVKSLLAEGRVRVGEAIRRDGSTFAPSPEESDAVASVLGDFEIEYRRELPGIPPAVHREALLWGALTVYRASSLLVYRDADPEIADKLLTEPCNVIPSPDACYSVDLTLRFMPDLLRLAKATSSKDPMIGSLKTLARRWPLSSVGIADLGTVEPETFLDDECLTRIYVDRIFAAKDRSRLNNTVVDRAVRVAIGIHAELVPDFVLESTPTAADTIDFLGHRT